MSLPCPKCGKHHCFREVITKNPPAEDLVYPCCSQRRHFYYDSIYGWESQADRQARVAESVPCSKCGKPIKLAYKSSEKGPGRSVCDECFVEYWRIVGEKRVEHNRKIAKNRKPKKRWLAHFKHGGHNGCQRDK